MIDWMQALDMVPVKHIASKGRVTIDGVMQKQFFFDAANTLHVSACLNSTDAANCYDVVNHPICSLAVQAIAGHQQEVSTYLRCIQQMTFYLRTGFGLSTTGYGGTKSSPFMGLVQGSCATHPIWTAVSTMILAACHHAGHGVEIRTA